jgi:polyhydroxyalkanoate synthesis regulator protein
MTDEPLNSLADIAKEHFDSKLKTLQTDEQYLHFLRRQLEDMQSSVNVTESIVNKEKELVDNAWKMYQQFAEYECKQCKQKYNPRHYEQTKCNYCEATNIITTGDTNNEQ